MKTKFIYLALAATAAFACTEKPEEIETPKKEAKIEVVNEADYKRAALNAEDVSIEILANTAWAVTVDKDWCTVTPASSKEAGKTDAEVVITVADNETAEPRTATVTVTAEGVTKNVTFTITQEAKSNLTVSDPVPAGNIPTDGGSKTFTVTSNSAWTAESNSEWLTLDVTSGAASATGVTVTATAAPNTGAARTATVTVKAGTETPKTIEIRQDMMVTEVTLKFVPLSEEEQKDTIAFRGEDRTFAIEGDATAADWDVVVSTPFATTYGTVAKGTNDVTVSFPSSQFAAPGPVTITLTTDGVESDKITVIQDTWFIPSKTQGSTIVMNEDGTVTMNAGSDATNGNTVYEMREGFRFGSLTINMSKVELNDAKLTLDWWGPDNTLIRFMTDKGHYVQMTGLNWHDWPAVTTFPAVNDIYSMKYKQYISSGTLYSESWINGQEIGNYGQWPNDNTFIYANTFPLDFCIIATDATKAKATGVVEISSVVVEVIE